MDEAITSRSSAIDRARSGPLARVVRAAAYGIGALSLGAVILTASAGLWLEAVFFGGAAIPPVWWASQYRGSRRESLSRSLSSRRDSDRATPSK